ncbi:hypothetical protein WAF17_09070 [Bernardetia sp. ABR2-2B]|uniref:hypothetical protein n=1 Tax=Bernardetia sp. ABR2-2B TaxID=3127472 RepID=UPI0030D0B7CA
MSKLLYNALQTSSLKQVINDLRKVCKKLNIDFFAIGALARNIWYVSNEKEARGTRDVDFAVYISDEESYQSLKKELIENYKYTQTTSNAFCLISPHNVELDLLPFGEIENDDRVKIEGKGLTTLNLDGFLETYKFGLKEFEIENEKLKICSLPAIVLLKLISFDDRPEERIKDAKDINSILLHYPNMETDLIWDEYNFLYDNEKSHQQVGIETLGYEIAKIIVQDEKLTKRVTNILKKAILKQSRLSIQMIENSIKETIEDKINLLKYLEFEIIEGIKN